MLAIAVARRLGARPEVDAVEPNRLIEIVCWVQFHRLSQMGDWSGVTPNAPCAPPPCHPTATRTYKSRCQRDLPCGGGSEFSSSAFFRNTRTASSSRHSHRKANDLCLAARAMLGEGC